MKKIILLLISSLVGLMLTGTIALAQITPQPLSLTVSKNDLGNLKAMTVKITTFDEEDNQLEGGTGLLLGNRDLDYFVATAKHVAEGSARISIPLDVVRKFDATVVTSFPGWDVAVIKFTADRKLTTYPIKVGKTPELLGTPLMVIGYPADECEVLLEGISLKEENFLELSTNEFLTFGEQLITPGYSGGPVFDDKLKLIGMCTEATQESSGGVLCLKYVEAIIPFLELEGVPYQFLVVPSAPPAPPVPDSVKTPAAHPLEGTWTNVNVQSGGITRLIVTRENGELYLQAFGQCQPRDCDWGKQPLADKGNNQFKTYFDPGFKITTLELTLTNGRLSVAEKSVYRDARKPAESTEIFRLQNDRIKRFRPDIKQAPPVKEPAKPSTVKPTIPLIVTPIKVITDAPVQLAPDDKQVFNTYPRATTLQWKPVDGAQSYSIELDCMGCCAAGKWCTDTGRTYQLKEGLINTFYNFNWVGAQKGRWRVWAKKAGGVVTAKSPWREFTYTR